MLNKVMLIGRLTRDPEIRFMPSGTQVTSFGLAVRRAYKTKDSQEWKEETYFFDIESFGLLAERLGKQLNKGDQILIEGELRQDRWETESGEKKSKVKVLATRVNRLLTKKTEEISNNTEEDNASLANDDDDVPF